MTDPWAPPPWQPAQPWTSAPPSPAASPWNTAPPLTGSARHLGPAPKPRRTSLVAGICVGVVVLLAIGFVGARTFLGAVTHGSDIAGAPGYVTFNGPTGNSFAVGRPFGPACQPIRFTVEEHVTDAVYAQVVSVVNEARADGLDVTVEDRSFNWHPDSLYYPPGTTSTNVQRVGIFVNNGSPTALPNGQPAHVILGYDASPDADGKHDDLVGPQGTLQMETLAGDVVGQRRAVREIVALTQGVAGSNRSDSGLGTDSTRDSFSPADVSAMKKMSGCNDSPDSIVEHLPT